MKIRHLLKERTISGLQIRSPITELLRDLTSEPSSACIPARLLHKSLGSAASMGLLHAGKVLLSSPQLDSHHWLIRQVRLKGYLHALPLWECKLISGKNTFHYHSAVNTHTHTHTAINQQPKNTSFFRRRYQGVDFRVSAAPKQRTDTHALSVTTPTTNYIKSCTEAQLARRSHPRHSEAAAVMFTAKHHTAIITTLSSATVVLWKTIKLAKVWVYMEGYLITYWEEASLEELCAATGAADSKLLGSYKMEGHSCYLIRASCTTQAARVCCHTRHTERKTTVCQIFIKRSYISGNLNEGCI